MKKLFIVCLSVLSLATGRAAEIHVALTGSDANPGSPAQPLATFAAAQAMARTRAGLEPVNVIFHAGTYYLADTIHFTAADSGTAGNPVTYRAAAGETVALSGGNPLAGQAWITHSGSIKKTIVPTGMVIDQLFAGQVKQNLARYPNHDPATRVFNGYASDCISTSRAATWGNPSGGFFHALHSGEWGGFHYRITGKNASNVVSYTGGQQNNRASAPHGTYRFVENIFEELNAPGEWFYNAAASTLYFYPPAGVDPSTAVMETAGRLKHLVQFDGSQAAPVKFVNLSGFVFRHAARTFMENYEPLLRSDWTIYRGAAVLLTGTEDCAISACEFDQLGGNAVFFSNYNRRSSVTGSYFHDIGASGVCFVGNPSSVRNPLSNYPQWNSYSSSSFDKTNAGPLNNNYPADCRVENCLITGIGRVEKQPAGVQISMASRITVRHCSIYECARSGINVGDGCWGGHIIEFCDTFDTVLETSDHGSFNSWGRDRFWNLRDATNSQLKAISLLDTYQPIILRNSRWQCDHGWDIDLDDGSSNYLIENNLLLNRGLKWREGFYRTGRNNIILKSSLHPHAWYSDSGDIFEKNIVSNAYQQAAMSSSLVTWGRRLDFNLFPTEAMRTAYASKGCDANSLSGSPMFVSPASGNYQVAAGSPALALGFVNFPMDQFGVTTRPFTVNSKSIVVRNPALISTAPPVKLTGVFRWLGSQVKGVTTIEEASSFGTNPMNGGVFFKGDYLGSAAAATGILESDLIASINGSTVVTVEDMVIALSAATGDVTFGIVRGQSPSNIVIPAASLTEAGTLALESGVMTVPAAGISIDSFILLGGLANGIGAITAGTIELQSGTVTVPLVSTGTLTKSASSTAIVAGGMTSPAGADISVGTLKLVQTLSPPVKSGLILRLDASSADSLVATGTEIGRWLDADGNGVYAEQNTPSKSPVLLAAAQNGRAVMDFGTFYSSESGRAMALKSAQGKNLDLTTIRTAFWVMQGSNHLLTSATSYDFHRAGDSGTSALWQSALAHASVRGGQTYLDGAVVNGTTTALASGFNLVSLVTSGNVGAGTLCSDRTHRSGGQKIAEVILYNRALSYTERQSVEAYLRYKWFGGPAPASTALAGADVAASATLDLGADFTHSQGTLTLNGSAQLNITGRLINQATIDIRTWSGTLPASVINQGSILTSNDSGNTLSFDIQPGGGKAGAVWTVQPVVTLRDSSGNPKLGTAQNVTLSIQNNADPGAVLSGSQTVAVDTATGRATFSGLSIDKPGTGYTLTARGNTVATIPGVVVSTAFSVTANTVPYAHYRMGDSTPASNGTGNLPYDASGNGRHMANKAPGTPIITSSGGPNNDAYYTFTGSNQYFFGTTAAWNPPEDNVGVEAWVRTSNLSQVDKHVFGTGDNTKGLNLGFSGGGWFGAVAGKTGVGSTGAGNYTAGTWIHIAAVRSAGITTFYANGYPMGSSTTVPNDASGTGILHMAVNSGRPSLFTGDIAEARIFTFAAGAFNPNTDLLVTPGRPVPFASRLLLSLPGQTYVTGAGNTGAVTGQTAGTPFNITLSAVDDANNLVTAYVGTKTVSYAGPANAPGGAAPVFTSTVTFINGQATGVATTLVHATATTITPNTFGLTGVKSSSVTVEAGTANKLAFISQPGGGQIGEAWVNQPAVILLDSNGNPKLDTAQNITVSIYNNAGPGAVLSGTKTVAVDTTTGVATFNGLSIDKSGAGYALTAIGDTVTTIPGVVISSAFSVVVPPGTIVWESAKTLSSSTDVSTSGTLLYAKYFSGISGAPATTVVNGVTFAKQSSSTAEISMSNTAINWSSIGAGSVTDVDYQKILIAPWFRAGTATLNNLIIGAQYQVQVWAQDARYNTGLNTTIIGGPSLAIDSISDGNQGTVSQGLGQFVIGTFIANATSQTIAFTGNHHIDRVVNAIQVRHQSVIANQSAINIQSVPSDYDDWSGSSGNNLSGGSTGDDDHDGLSNRTEYAFGLNPNSGASSSPITVALDKKTGTFSYTRRATSKTNLTYTVWFSTDLGDWTQDTNAIEEITIVSGDVETVEVTLSSLPGVPLPSKLFIQVRADEIPEG